MKIVAESGGTKTDWRFIDSRGKIEQYASSGLNPTYASQKELLELLNKEMIPKYTDVVEEIHFYGAGCQGEESKQKILNALLDYFGPCRNIHINHDLLAAARACSKDAAGIICILGTGSNACLYDGETIIKNIPNLGFILGDEGSGAFMGKQLLKDFFENKLPLELSKLFSLNFPALSRDALIDQLYRKESPNKFLAQFFPFILENQKSPYCQNLIVKAFDEFIQKVEDCFSEETQLPLHFVGGVAFHANPILRRVLQKRNLQTGIIMESPIAGLTLYHQKVL